MKHGEISSILAALKTSIHPRARFALNSGGPLERPLFMRWWPSADINIKTIFLKRTTAPADRSRDTKITKAYFSGDGFSIWGPSYYHAGTDPLASILLNPRQAGRCQPIHSLHYH